MKKQCIILNTICAGPFSMPYYIMYIQILYMHIFLLTIVFSRYSRHDMVRLSIRGWVWVRMVSLLVGCIQGLKVGRYPPGRWPPLPGEHTGRQLQHPGPMFLMHLHLLLIYFRSWPLYILGMSIVIVYDNQKKCHTYDFCWHHCKWMFMFEKEISFSFQV